MSSKKLSLIKFKLKLPKIQSGSRFGLAKNRHRDWNTILWTTIILGIVIAGLSLYMFYRVDSGTIFRDYEFGELEKRGIDLDSMNDSVLKIQNKRMLFETKLLEEPNTSDPSR